MRIKHDESGKRFYETGVSKGVLYVANVDGNGYGKGVAWNGLTSVSESPEGAEANAIYADNMKYLNLMSAEDFKGTIEAYTYPDEFMVCDGSANLLEGVPGITVGQQSRRKFAVCYRTEVGNDETSEKGYKLHIVYNCLASPSERSYETINDSPEAITFSWEFSTTPVAIANSNLKATAIVVIDSTKLPAEKAAKLTKIEDALYGTDGESGSEGTDARLLMPEDIIDILNSNN